MLKKVCTVIFVIYLIDMMELGVNQS